LRCLRHVGHAQRQAAVHAAAHGTQKPGSRMRKACRMALGEAA
jgi:hypothetical protein